MKLQSKNSATQRTGVLIILDGFGMNPQEKFNAVAGAKMPHFRRLLENYPHTQLKASEGFVGLPKGFMGNSEVGHLNIGAGRIVYQDFSLISKAIEDGSFFKNPAFEDLYQKMQGVGEGAALHLIGLVSDGGVHSHQSHLYALIQWAKRQGIKDVKIHVITDGRDTSPTSGLKFVKELESFCKDSGLGKIATISGRFYAMDRDNRWDRVEKAYRTIVSADSPKYFSEAESYIRELYDQKTTDEFLTPGHEKHYKGIQDRDAIIFFNFRADRARELTRALTQREFTHFQRKQMPVLSGFVCMTPYDSTLNLPTAFEKAKVPMTLGEVVSRSGGKQLRIAETEKYAHVTYFFNGGDETVLQGEERVLVPSPREVPTYDLKPEMSAEIVCQKLLSHLKSESYQLAVVNFANPDMVGHTGNYSAAVKALEVVDQCIGEIVAWVESTGNFALLTADHGNCEVMIDEHGMPMTAHTLFPVPLILIDPSNKNLNLNGNGRLCDIAPTILKLWGLPQPGEMTGQSLI